MYRPWWMGVRVLMMGILLTVMAPVQAQNEAAAADITAQDSQSRELADLQAEQARLQQQGNDIAHQLQQAPDLVAQMRKEIGVLENQSQDTRVPKSVDAMESAINLLEAQVKAMQINLSDVMDRISEQQALPTVAREQVTSAQKQIQALQDKLRAASQADQNLPAATTQIQILKQQISNANLRKDIAQNSLEGYQKLLELYTVNRDLLLLRMGGIKTALGLLRNERDSLRQEKVEKEQQAAAKLQTDMAEKPGVVISELEQNQQLTLALATVTDNLSHANDNLADGKQELQDIRYRYDIAEQQLQLTEFYQYVDDYLLRQRQNLQTRIKEQQEAGDYSHVISQARLDQFKYDDQLHQVRTTVAREQMADDLLANTAGLDEAKRSGVRRDLLDVLSQREDLLSKLVEANAKYVVALTNLELLAQDQMTERQNFFELLNRKLLWRRSGQPLDWDWARAVPASLTWFVLHPGWIQLLDVWRQTLVQPVFPLLAVLAVMALLLAPRQRALRRLAAVKDKIGNVMKDQFRYTAEALVITLFLAAPLPLLIVLLGYPLLVQQETSLFVSGVGQALLAIARWVLLFEFIRALCRENGLASAHFSWRPSSIDALKRWMPMLYWQLPWAFVFIVVWRDGDQQHAGLLGRGAYMLMAALFWVFVWRLMHPRVGITQRDEGREVHWYQTWNHLLYGVALAFPSVLILLALAGFNFSAMMLHVHLYQTIMYAFMIFVLDQVFTRWFAVQERKIALARALAKREAMKKAKEQQEAAKSSGDSVPEVEMPTIDVATISEQNRALLRVLSYSAFLVTVWWTWRDLFQAADMFGQAVLWTYSLDTGDGAQNIPVTLATLVFTLVAIALTYIGVKNLPGLIEVVVLQRFKIDSGVRFAVTTTARYLVMITGVLVVSKMVGLDWSKLGWLVAALGVGLGFGLQEIFANFISGLIILYERPIRIGDTVTINDLSGTVSRIRMRATTITDWDQKELIIPNKTFVTNQFINWTLSDNVTRLVVPVGVAYGSNTQLVTETLLSIAKAHDTVMREPAPTALFLGFGDSTLNFELRVFIDQFTRRMILLHDLNTEIDKRFNALGISIAFPQLDVHVKELPAVRPDKTSD